MHAKWMRLWGMVAVVLLLAPLMAVAQYGSRETHPYSKSDKSRETHPYSSSDKSRESRGEIEVVNDLREEVSLSMSSEDRELLGEWSISPGENVVLQDRGERIRVRSNDKIKVGDDEEWVTLDQVGKFQNGVWRVDMRDVWAATQQDRPEGRDSRSGGASPKETSPTGEGSPLNEILKRMK
jgi:hypothetical protein